MLLGHGTTEIRADQIYECGHFQNRTPFLKLEPDKKLALCGTAGFAFRDHPIVDHLVDIYCKQDLICAPWKPFLKKYGKAYSEGRKYDAAPGLIFVVDVPDNAVDFPSRFFANWHVPTNVDSIEEISTDCIKYIVTLKEHENHFKNKYGAKVETPLEDIALGPVDPLMQRIKYSLSTRYNRLILGRN